MISGAVTSKTADLLCRMAGRAQSNLEGLLVGRPVRIADPNYNGQPIGASRPSLAGVETRITDAWFSRNIHREVEVMAYVEDRRAECALRLSDLELLDLPGVSDGGE